MNPAFPLSSLALRRHPGLRGLPLLRARIRDARVPHARPGNLRLATWNIREFGKASRRDESVSILAEVMRTFDLVSIVELRDDLRDLARVIRALGSHWKVVYSDYLRDAGGNHERNAFLFDTRRVQFTGLASTAESPRLRRGNEYERAFRWWRPPFLASFAACESPFDFIIVSAHVRWGKSADARETEMAALGDWVLGRTREPHFGDPDVFVLGDFNVQREAFDMLRGRQARRLEMAPGLERSVVTDLARRKRYDQILYVKRTGHASCFSGRAGSVDFYQGDHHRLMHQAMSKERFTHEVSDHLPLWAEVVTREALREQELGK